MPPRFIWMDDSDPVLCRERLDSLKERFSSWEFIRWEELFYENPNEAYQDLSVSLNTIPMFTEGKVVYCFGIPNCQAEIAEQIESIPQATIFLIIGGIDKRTVLYKAATAMKDSEIDDPLSLKDKDAALSWLKRRASEICVDLDETAARMLVDFVGTNPAKLISELNKVKHMADGKVFPWAVEQACYTDGDEEITEVVNLLTKGDHDGAHEYVDRIMSKNESFDRICGFLSSWLRRMAIAEAGSGDYKSVKDNLGLIMKYQKPLKSDVKVIRKLKEEIAMTSLMNTKVISKLMEKLEKEHEKTKTKAVQMFPKPGAMFYGCEQFNKACKYRSEQSLSRAWVMGLILFLLESQKKVRNGEADQRCVLHDFIMKFSHGVSYV